MVPSAYFSERERFPQTPTIPIKGKLVKLQTPEHSIQFKIICISTRRKHLDSSLQLRGLESHTLARVTPLGLPGPSYRAPRT